MGESKQRRGRGERVGAALARNAPALLATVTHVLRESGMSPAAIRAALEAARQPSRTGDAARRAVRESTRAVAWASHLMHAWYAEPDYLVDGRPRALPPEGPAPSVDSLLAATVPEAARAAVRGLLQRSPSVRIERDGRWRPVGREVVRVDADVAVHRVIGLVEGLLRANLVNMGPAGRRDEGHIDRSATTVALPDRLRVHFEHRAREQLVPALEHVSQWLERSSTRHGRRSTREVGAAVFTYELPEVDAPGTPRRARASGGARLARRQPRTSSTSS